MGRVKSDCDLISLSFFLKFGLIDLLSQYQTALQKKERTEKEHDDHSEYMKSPELLKKKKDMEEKNKQLEEIGRQISMFVRSKGRKLITSFFALILLVLLISNWPLFFF